MIRSANEVRRLLAATVNDLTSNGLPLISITSCIMNLNDLEGLTVVLVTIPVRGLTRLTLNVLDHEVVTRMLRRSMIINAMEARRQAVC